MSRSVATHRQGSVSMSVVHVTTKGHVDIPGGLLPVTMLMPEGYIGLYTELYAELYAELAPTLPGYSTGESWPHPLPGAGPAPPLGSTVVLVLTS